MLEKIKKISQQIHSELEDAEKYIKCALKYKDEDKDLADIYYWLSQEEMAHADKLHRMVVDQIDLYKKNTGEPPESMMAVYEYVHDQEIEEAKEVKLMWVMYKA